MKKVLDTLSMSETRVYNTSTRGKISELCIELYLSRLGEKVLKTSNGSLSYDLALDNTDGTIERLQIKTGRICNGCLNFNTAWINRSTGARTSYKGLADWFVIWSPELQEAFMIKVTKNTSGGYLRVEKPKNNQTKGIKLAKNYKLSVVIKKLRTRKPLRY